MSSNEFPGRIAVMGRRKAGPPPWPSCLLKNCESIIWYMRRDDRIEDFMRLGHNPAYLTDVPFDTARIEFSSDINHVASTADTLLLVMPSPYFKSHLEKVEVDLSDKYIVSAVKGIVPDENQLVTDYMIDRFGVKRDHTLVVSGPCHAEEVALERPFISHRGGVRTSKLPASSATASAAQEPVTVTPSSPPTSTASSMPE